MVEIKPYYEEENITIYNGDCLEVMKELPDKSIDLVLTDPPYNAKNIGPKCRKYSQGIMQLPEKEYKKFCKSWFSMAGKLSKNIVFTPGIANTHNYPQPYWIICWHKPAAVSFNKFQGYNAWEPIFVYGKNTERIGQDYLKINTLNFKKGPEREHPCPKVPELINWLVIHFSNEGDTILDPFLGSGTTARACKDLGRKCIGIEISQKYCDIAVKRLGQEVMNFAEVNQ